MSITVATLKALLTLDVSDFTANARKAKGESDGFTGTLAKMGTGSVALGTFLGGMATAGASALMSVGKSAITMGIQTAGAAEQSQIAFTKFFNGNAQAADAFQKKLMDFAAQTPFDFPQLREAASGLMAVGVNADKVIPIMTSLGDSIAAVGGSQEDIGRATLALEQMTQKGKVTGEEMMQLTEAGIPAWDALAAKIGVDIPTAMKMVEKGSVGAGVMMDAMAEHTGQAMARTTGMMQVQSQTLIGLWSTVKDTLSMDLANAFQPLVKGLEGVLPQVSSALDQLLQGIGPPISALLTTLVQAFTSLLPVLTPVLTILGGTLAQVGSILLAALLPALQAVGPQLPSLAKAFGELAVALTTLLVALLPLIIPLIQLQVQLTTAMAGHITAIVNALIPMAEWLGRNEVAVKAALAAFIAWKAVNMYQALATLLPMIVSQAAAWIYYAGAAWSAAAAVIAATWPFLLAAAAIAVLIGGLIYAYQHWDTFRNAVDKVGEAAVWVWNSVLVPFGGWITGSLVPALQTAGGAVAGFAEALAAGFMAAVGFIGSIPERLGAIVEFFEGLPGKVVSALAGLWTTISTWVLTTAAQLPGLFVGWVSSFVSWLPGAVAALPGQLAYMLGFIIGFILGAALIFPIHLVQWGLAFLNWVMGLVGQMPGWLLNLQNTIVLFLIGGALWIGQHLIQWTISFMQWVFGVAAQIPGWLVSVASAIIGWLVGAVGWLVGHLASWTSSFLGWVMNLAASFPGWLASVSSSFVGWLTSQGAQLPGRLVSWANAFLQWAGNLAASFPGWLAGATNALRGWVAGIPGAMAGAIGGMLSVGRSIVEGIWAGISGAGGWLAEKARSFASGLVAGFLSAIKGGSPALIMLPVGMSLTEGIGWAMMRGAGALQRTINDVMGGLEYPTGVAQLALTPGIGVSGVLAGAYGPTDQRQPLTVVVNGQARSDDATAVVAALSTYDRVNGRTWRTGTSDLVHSEW